MRIQRVAIAATAALLGSLALSACSGSATGSVTAGGRASVSASGSAAAGTGSASGSASGSVSAPASGSAAAPASGDATTDPGSTAVPAAAPGNSVPNAAPTGGSGGGSAATPAACTTAHLAFGIGPDSGPQTVTDTTAAEVVKLTNTGSASCAMRGFPGVDLRTNAGTISVQRSRQTPRLVTLAPGDSALFDIDYPVNNTGGSGVRVETMVITPPNETHSHLLAWNLGTLPATDGPGSPVTVDPVVSFPG